MKWLKLQLVLWQKLNLDKADKALVDKLAAEFAEELDNLGVRVSDLEKKSDNVKWSGTVRYRYTDVDKTKPSGNSEHNLLFRIEPHAYIGNTGWMAHSRVEYLSDIGNDENFDATVDRAWVEGPALGGTWKLGKYPILPMNGLLLDDKVSGAEVIFNNDNLKTTIQAGRFNTDRSAANPDMDKLQQIIMLYNLIMLKINGQVRLDIIYLKIISKKKLLI